MTNAMTPEQLHQIDQARRYAEQDEYVVTRTHIRNLLVIIEGEAVSVPDGWRLAPVEPTPEMLSAADMRTYDGGDYDEHLREAVARALRRIYAAMLAAAPEVPKS